MIDAVDIVVIARENFDKMFTASSLREVLLEETELSDDERFWQVTFSFDWQPTSGTSSIGPGDRRYKVFKLDAENGRMISVKTPEY